MSFHLGNKRNVSFRNTVLVAAIVVIGVIVVYPVLRRPAAVISNIGTRMVYSAKSVDAPVTVYAISRGGSLNDFVVRSMIDLVAGTRLYNSAGELVATISDDQIAPHLYRAQLISYPQSDIAVKVLVGDTHQIVRAVGRGAGTLLVELPTDAQVLEGSPVALSDSTPIGVVTVIKLERQAPYQRLFITPTIPLTATDGLYIK
jgi:hypothetical protein